MGGFAHRFGRNRSGFLIDSDDFPRSVDHRYEFDLDRFSVNVFVEIFSGIEPIIPIEFDREMLDKFETTKMQEKRNSLYT